MMSAPTEFWMMRWQKRALDIDTCHKLDHKRAIILIWAANSSIRFYTG